MNGVAVILACCVLYVRGRHPDVLAVGSSSKGNFLDNDKWLRGSAQYEKDKYWDKFRDNLCMLGNGNNQASCKIVLLGMEITLQFYALLIILSVARRTFT